MKVQTISLDQYAREQSVEQIDLIKLDIEGCELAALRGMSELLSHGQIRYLYVEINPFLLERQQVQPETVKAFLASFGYRLYRLSSERLVPVSPHTPENQLCNLLAVCPERVRLSASRSEL